MESSTQHLYTEVCIFSPARSIEHIELSAQLKALIGVPISLVSNPNQVAPNQLIAFDCQEVSASRIEQWLAFQAKENRLRHCILLNMGKSGDHTTLIDWPQIVAMFFSDTTLAALSCGFKQALSGKLSLPNELMAAFMKRLRRIPSAPRLTKKDISLTHRELQILDCVYSGFSNARIADHLALSEHTIKTHLSNAFRKIGISSRLEACAWVRENYSRLFPQLTT